MLIEDNKAVRENITEILELDNYEVLSAPNGKVGVDLATKDLPDLIICDIMMPELDGYGVLHMLSKNAKTSAIPFIFLTAKTDRADLRKGMGEAIPFDDESFDTVVCTYTLCSVTDPAQTLAELRREYPQAELFLVLGADQLLAFRQWVRWQEVVSLATLAVAARARSIGAQALDAPPEEADLSGVDLPFVGLTMPLNPVSATAVRARLAAVGPDAAALDVLVPAPVASYISQNHLYQTPT